MRLQSTPPQFLAKWQTEPMRVPPHGMMPNLEALKKASLGNDLTQFRGKAPLFFSGASQFTTQEDFMMKLRNGGVLVCGASGIMGNGIAQAVAANHLPVYLQDTPDRVALAQDLFDKGFQEAEAKGVFSQSEVASIRHQILGRFPDLKYLSQMPTRPALVIEAIPEKLEWKKALFQELVRKTDSNTILATNTSSLSVTDIAKDLPADRRSKVVGIHFFKPAEKNKLVEIIRGAETSDQTVAEAVNFVRALGKVPVVCADTPGFIVNRIGIPLINEGLKMVSEGFANVTTIDQTALKLMWPTAHKKYPDLAKKVLLPATGINQENYMDILGHTMPVLEQSLGSGYSTTPLIHEKAKQYRLIMAGAKDQGWPPSAVEALLEPQRIHPKAKETFDPKQSDKVKDRMLGLVFGITSQLLEGNTASPSDIDRALQMGLGWEVGPVTLMNQMGPQQVFDLVKAYQTQFNPAFQIPSILKTQAEKGNLWVQDNIDVRMEGPIGILVLNRPHRANALDLDTMLELRNKFREMVNNPEVHFIVLESAGGRMFSAGADLPWLNQKIRELQGSGPLFKRPQGVWDFLNQFINTGRELMQEIEHSPKPVIAVVNGPAMGGGLELALACDSILTTEHGRFAFPELKYGIFPAWGGVERIQKRLTKPLAKWMILEGGKLNSRGKGDAVVTGQESTKIHLADHHVSALNLDTFPYEKLFAHFPSLTRIQTPHPRVEEFWLPERMQPIYARYEKALLSDLKRHELKGINPLAIQGAMDRFEHHEEPLKTGDYIRLLLSMVANPILQKISL